MKGLDGRLREAVGKDMGLAIDCHLKHGLNDAIKLA